MNNLVSEHVSWEVLEPYRSGDFVSEITDAYIEKESGRITVELRSNFVVPVEDEKRLKTAVLEMVPGLTAVRIKHTYVKDQMALTEEGIVHLLIPRILVEFGPSVVHAVDMDKCTVNEDRVEIVCFGRMMTEKLNLELAGEIAMQLRDLFGVEREIVFLCDEEGIAKAKEKYSQGPEDAAEEAIWDAWAEDAPPLTCAEEELLEEGDAMPPWVEIPPMGSNDAGPSGTVSKPKSSKRRSASNAIAKDFERVMGKVVKAEVIPMTRVTEEAGTVAVKGWIYHIESRPIKNDRCIVTMLVTDKKSSACLKFFTKQKKWEEMSRDQLHEGDYILAEGNCEWDTFERAVDIMVKSIMKGEAPKRKDTWEGQHRVELHCHTKMSAMDAINDPEQIVEMAANWGQPAVAITDHGVVQGFPDAANKAEKLAKKGKNIKVLYGMEGYLMDDTGCINPDGTIEYKKKPTNHIIFLCRTQAGLKNLYKLVSISHLHYFFKRPRLPRSVINQYREGIILGSACEAGEVFRAISHGLPEEEIERIASWYDYLEIQPIVNNEFLLRNGTYQTEEDLRDINRRIVELGKKLGKPVVATTDAHYDEPESAIYRNIILASMGFKDAVEGHGLYLRTTDEMMEEFSYLGEDAQKVVIDNTNLVASWVEDGIKPVPDEKYPPKIEGAEETLRKTCYDTAHEMYGDPLPEPIQERLDTELNAIISNGYAVMYVSAQLLVKKSLEDGYLVGSRGSVGSSFAATMAGITEVNPLNPHYICPNCKHLEWGDMQQYDNGIDMPVKNCPECGTEMHRDGFSIPFATFLGFSGNKEPDIDLNFAGEYQPRAHKYVGVIFGDENVFKAGTVGTVAEKTAFGFVRHFFDETGLPVNKFEIDRLKMGCTGVKRTTGQHPGGIIIVPRDHEIYEFCPVQHPANDTKTDIITTHFDYHKIDKNLLKLDILGHNVPQMIRQLQDMTGVDPLTLDLTDQTVLSIFNGIEALKIKDPEYRFHHGTFGIPEFGTSFTRQMLDDVKPKRFEDLVRMSGFSHGTDVWLNNAQEYIRDGVATMREVISTRDDIMNFCLLHGIDNENSFRIMEEVRKKNLELTDEHQALMKEKGIPDWYIDSCAKIKYMFPRAHAVAYVMMSFRMAWFKVYYPQEFYATYLTSVISNFDAETILKGKDAVLARMDAIKAKGKEASQKEKEDSIVFEVVYEMYARGYEFLPAELGASKANKFWVKDDKVLLPFSAYAGVGDSASKDLVAAYEEKPFSTIEDCAVRSGVGKSVIEVLRKQGVFGNLPESDQMCWSF